MVEFLVSKIKEYVSINEFDIQIIKSLFVKEEFKANETILKDGMVCNKVWFIAKGLLRFSINLNGEDRTFVFRNENCFTSDIESFIKKRPSTKSIIAIEDSILYSTTNDNLQILFKEITNGERFGRLLIEEIFVMAVGHIASFYTESPEQRYVKFAHQNSDFLQRIPQYHIASFLGIKPQSLCRIKKRLLKNNL